MSINVGFLWGCLIFLFSTLTSVFVIGLCLRWKFRSEPAIKARQKYAQSLMLILCYFIGIGSGHCAMVFQKEQENGLFRSYHKFVVCLIFGHYALMNVYFYRVWILYYKCKLQNEFEKVTRNPATLTESTMMNRILLLGSGSSSKFELSEESDKKERLLNFSEPKSVRNSWPVRYRKFLGRNFWIRGFWLFLFMCECNVIYWTYRPRSRNSNVEWFPRELADELFTLLGQLMCLTVLFFFPSDDLFRIKIELRLIFLISTMGVVLWYTLLYRIGTPEAYLSQAISALLIMVAMTWTNWRAVRKECWCSAATIIRLGRSFHKFDWNSDMELSIMDILECEGLFQAFERHLKREFSLENLNFLVAVVQFRQLCEENKYSWEDHDSIRLNGNETTSKTQKISMKPLGISTNTLNWRTSIDSYSWLPTTPPDVYILNGIDWESQTSAPNSKTPWGLTKKNKEIGKSAPRLTWVESQLDIFADEQKSALFIFAEYCDRGAPQEINISKTERTALVEFFSRSEINPDELTTVFDRSFDSILDLLENDSLRRFKRRSSFHKLIKN